MSWSKSRWLYKVIRLRNHTVSQQCECENIDLTYIHLTLSGVLTFVASHLVSYRCMLSYFEEAVNSVQLYTDYFTLFPSTFLHCLPMKRDHQMHAEMWGLYSLLWDNFTPEASLLAALCELKLPLAGAAATVVVQWDDKKDATERFHWCV